VAVALEPGDRFRSPSRISNPLEGGRGVIAGHAPVTLRSLARLLPSPLSTCQDGISVFFAGRSHVRIELAPERE
jgi:hypothetical protein